MTRKIILLVAIKLFNIFIPLRTISNYIKHFGFSPQKILKYAYEQNTDAINKWLKKNYPKIKRRAKKEKATIHWIDETGLRSNSNYIRSYAPKSKTPVIKTTGKRLSINLISSITNQDKMRFITLKNDSKRLVEFIYHLYKNNESKIFLILDNLAVHHSKHFKAWLKNKNDKVEIFYSPAYSPKINQD